MRKDFFNFLKEKRKKYAKFILCYSLSSIIACTQCLPVLAASTDEVHNSMIEDTISSTIETSSYKVATKEDIETEASSTISETETSTKDTNSSKDAKDSNENGDSAKESSDFNDESDGSKDNADSNSNGNGSKDTSDSKENDNSKDNADSSDDENTDDKEDSDSKDDSEDSEDDADSSNSEDSSKADSTEVSKATTENDNETESTTEENAYETVEDIEIATEDPTEYDDNELLVQFKTDVSESKIDEIAEMLPETTLDSYSDGIAVFSASSKTVIEEDIAILSTIEEISIIQPNYKYSFSSAEEGSEVEEVSDTITSSLPNDTFFDKQWGLYNNGTVIPDKSQSSPSSSGIDINVLSAWQNLQSPNEVIVAVIDTGVDYQHKDLKDHMWYNKAELEGTNGVDDDNNGYADDIYGWDFYNDDASVCHYSGTTANKKDNDNHGTRCAGIIAATANNNFGIAGVASNVDVKIMSLKTAGGPDAEGDTANIIKAIKYASYNGAKICNASWNCDNDDPALKLAITESNMLFICSAGNGYGTDIDEEPSYPCSYNLTNTVGVTSIDSDGTLSYFSNYGQKAVSMAAPGSNICSTIVGKYGYDSGTSMAAPFVTGVAAMLYAYDSTLYPARAKNILLSATRTLSALQNKVSTNGLIDAALAVSILQGKTYKEDTTPPTITPTVLPRKDGAYLSVSVKDTGGSCTRIRRYAYGKQSASYFKNGENGKSLAAGTKPYVTKEGYYTIYAQDNAGNQAVKVIKVSFDKTAPSLSLSYKKSGTKYKITIKASDSASGMSEVRYAKSKHSASYLKSNGTKLGAFTGTKTITASQNIYSFYAKDKAGNYVTKTITIDETAPSLSLSYKKSGRKYIITVKASDSVSGLSEVRYAKSKHSASYLKSKGTKLSSFSKSKSITVSSRGTYSFYAKDKSGNVVVKTLTIK